ncbi:MAG: hypothetical protein L6R37_005895 [Teloschistes peruensis]|nr:MAG: hypothetical protein L6R37_005895 [Teloschistes peruensis]
MAPSRIPIPIAKVPGWRCAALSQEPAIDRQMAKTAPLTLEELAAQRIASRKRKVLKNLSPKVAAAAAKLVPPVPCDCCRHRGTEKKKLRWKPKETLVKTDTFKVYPKECWPDRLERAKFDRDHGWHANDYATFTEEDALAEDDEE